VLLLAAATDYRGLLAGSWTIRWPRHAAISTRRPKKPFDDLRAAQKADHEEWFNRVELDLPATANSALPTLERLAGFAGRRRPALAALYFNYGRYLLISSSRPGGLPANLQGIWAEEIQTPWNGDWHLDINVQMNYWPAEVCNLIGAARAAAQADRLLVEPGRKTAQGLLQRARLGGARHHQPVGLHLARRVGRVWGATVSGSAWLCQHLWEHYAFTLDREFLRWAYPILKESALFYLDNLIEEPKHRWLVTGPSNSPENAFIAARRPWPTSASGRPSICSNAARAVRQHRAGGGDPRHGRRPAPRTAGQARPPRPQPDRPRRPPAGMAGALSGARADPPPHLAPVRPASLLEITPRGTPELAAACRKSSKPAAIDSNGWALAWRMNFWARLGDGDRAHKLLRDPAASHQARRHLNYTGRGAGSYANLF
jgi:alpha-L-fucosidase 2